MRWITWGTWLLVALAGCDRPQDTIDQQACSLLCDCFADPGETAQDQCIRQCVVNLGPVGPGCQACISRTADRCTALESECEETCLGPLPDPTGELE